MVLEDVFAARGDSWDRMPPVPIGPEDLAYVMFTSGSSGRPKGVMIPHGGPAALLEWTLSAFDARDLAGVLFSTSVCFDLSVFEMTAALGSGGTLILARDALHLAGHPHAGKVTLLSMIPSSVMELVRAGAVPPSVRAIVMGGEPVTPSLARACLGLEGQPRVLNLYGTTEDTVHSTLFPVTEVSGDRIPVGVPIAGSHMYIARGPAELALAGEVGEILLAGPKLALGYFGRPELTAERFVEMEVAPGQVERVYRTGDLGRLREDGLFECLGRLDSQVKVRGYRVEPEEISGSLCTCPGVADAAVLPEGDLSDRHLVAFVVPVKGETPEPEHLERWLRRSLPAYMVPSRWEYLDVLPRLPNGKLDRERLSKLLAAGSGRAPPPSRPARWRPGSPCSGATSWGTSSTTETRTSCARGGTACGRYNWPSRSRSPSACAWTSPKSWGNPSSTSSLVGSRREWGSPPSRPRPVRIPQISRRRRPSLRSRGSSGSLTMPVRAARTTKPSPSRCGAPSTRRRCAPP